ncbi:unnamed protein product [Trifolium pratense]|uniref:Uncharacterized protein n=1 Tax=Trifolium pratense TaxID=57577 RepID=A0ACB0LHC0_TRIPR|nr:unnamed protein product [Trifolium pratense]
MAGAPLIYKTTLHDSQDGNCNEVLPNYASGSPSDQQNKTLPATETWVVAVVKWKPDFFPHTQRQTHVQSWNDIYELPQEYWRPITLFEIAGGVGTPLMLDEATKNRSFGHYARVLVDIDLSKRAFEAILVEREGHAFYVDVVYEKLPDYCTHCQSIGHSVKACNKLQPRLAMNRDERASKPVMAKPQTKAIYIEKDNTSKVARSIKKEAEIARKDNIVEGIVALNISLNSEPIITPVNMDAEHVNNYDINIDVNLDDENTIVIHDFADDALMNKLSGEEATVLDTTDNVIPATH